MRTTIELTDQLLKRAKIVAVERGTTLRALVESALERELSISESAPAPPRRVNFPIFHSKQPGTMNLTNADIAAMEAEEDIRRLGLAD